MEIGDLRLTHVRFQYYEKEKIKNCPKHGALDPILTLALAQTSTPTLPIKLFPERIRRLFCR